MMAFSHPVTQSQALAMARQFGNSGNLPMKCAYVRQSPAQGTTAQSLYYVFNRGDNQGYVVVAGDDRVMPILAWSDSGELTQEDIENHPSIKWMYDEYSNQIQWAIKNLPDVESSEFRHVRQASANYTIEQEPLLAYENDRTTKRAHAVSLGQDWPFNRYCPNYVYNGRSYPTVSGCVATAICTVLRWHEWPNKAVGSFSYYWNGQKLSLNFDEEGAAENKEYDWSQMPEAVDAYGRDRATNVKLNDTQSDNYGRLLRDVGYCVKMNYGPASTGGSGAYVYDVPRALRENFSYDSNVTDISREDYTTENWLKHVHGEMDSYGPVIYAGYSSGGGHCFVLDGYATNGYVHVDWGWNGSSNGWHLLDVLQPGTEGIGGGSGGYSRGQEMIRYLKPNRDEEPDPDPEDENVGEKLYITSEITGQTAGQTSTETLKANVGNKHESKSWSDYLYMAIYTEGSSNSTIVGKTYQYIAANGEAQVSFTCDLSKTTAGTYLLAIYYYDGSEYKYVGSAGSVTVSGDDPEPQPDEKYELAVTGSSINATVEQGSDYKFTVNVENSGNADYTGNLSLIAYSRSDYSETVISSGEGTIAANSTVTVTFHGNDAFKALAAGDYYLMATYNNEGTTDYLRLSGSRYIGNLTITEKEEPDPVEEQDVSLTTAAFYQYGYYLGQEYATVSKKWGPLTTYVYLSSENGYEDAIDVYIASTRNGYTGDNGLEKLVNISMSAGLKGYVKVTWDESLLRRYYYYLNILYKDVDGKWYYNPSDAVAFYVRGFYDNDPNHEYSTEPTDGPSYEFDVAPEDMIKNYAITIGADTEGGDLTPTGIGSVKNEKVSFSVTANENLTIFAPEAGTVSIYNAAGMEVMRVNVKAGFNTVNGRGIAQGIYVARMNGNTVKFMKK